MSPGWVAAVAVGMVLILIPEPATTATGLAIVAGAVGNEALKSRSSAKKKG